MTSAVERMWHAYPRPGDHWVVRYVTRVCERMGVPFREDLPVVFERFDLVWPMR